MKKTVYIKIIPVLLLLSSTITMAQNKPFVVNVFTDKPDTTYKAFILYRKKLGSSVMDSVKFNNGKYELSGTTSFPQRAFLWIEKENTGFGKTVNNKQGIQFYIEEGIVKIVVKENPMVVKRSGTRSNDDYELLLDKTREVRDREYDLNKKYMTAIKAKDNELVKSLETNILKVQKQRADIEEEFFHNHLNSFISYEWLVKNVNMGKQKSKAIAMFNKLDNRFKDLPGAQNYKVALDKAVSVEIGSTAPDIIAKSFDDREVKLSDYRGKYVLLDFWASWCVPCRRENPNLLKAYDANKSKNFEILAFSLDTSKDKWSLATKQDGMPWAQVSDLAGFNSPIVKLFQVNAIPNNFLIGPDGKILATNLRGEEIHKTLKQFLN